VRFNLLAYFLIVVTSALAASAGALLRQPNAFFRANGYAVAAASLILLAWPLIAWLVSLSPGSSATRASGPGV
jgi:hypothetical protein